MSSIEVVMPQQLLSALDAQSRTPIARIGEALTSLGMVTDEQLRAGLAQQQRDRGVPLGETLVRMGIVRASCRPRWPARWAIRWSTWTSFPRGRGAAQAPHDVAPACRSCR
jgi:hypothetical protein